MGVSNVYNQAKSSAISALKQNMASQASKKLADAKPSYLTKNGSIFNAPKLQSKNSITDLNTRKSLSELNKKPDEKGVNPQHQSSSNGISNEGEGKAAASSMEAQSKSLSQTTNTVEKFAGTVNGFETSSEKLDKKIAKDDKKFAKTVQKQEKELKKDNTKLEKLAKDTQEIQKEVDNAQHELDKLLASNSFSMDGSNQSANSTGSSSNQSKITELQTFIGAKVGIMQSNGKQIYSLQRSQSKTLASMNKTNAAYIKTNQKNTKALEQQEAKTNDVVEFATKAEQIAQLVEMGGQTIELLGKGLVLASTTPWTAWMRPVGMFMQKVGVVAQTVGKYGQAAANITKTAAYAADGNIAGALQSAGAALQTGAAAVKSTKAIKSEFTQINKQGQEAMNKLAAKTAAKDAVKEMSPEQLGGMTKKEMKKSISSNLQEKMNKGELDAKGLYKDLRSGKLSDGNFEAVDGAAATSRKNFSNAVTKAGGSVDSKGVVSGLDKKARKNIGKNSSTGFTNTASKTAKSSVSFEDKLDALGKTFSSSAAIFAQFSRNNTNTPAARTQKGTAPQWDLSQDARYQRIARSNHSYRAHAMY